MNGMEDGKTELIENGAEGGANSNNTSKRPIWKSKLFLIITGICIVAVIAVITTVVLIAGNGKSDIEKRLETANRYLVELDYEQAKAEFEEIIKADPKCEEAYIGLAEAYEGIGEPDKVREILEEGYEKTKSEKIKKMLDEMGGETTDRIVDEIVKNEIETDETTAKKDTAIKDSTTNVTEEKVQWRIEGDTIIIYGNGAMDDYYWVEGENAVEGTTAPWFQETLSEVKVKIEENVTSTGKYAFFNCKGVTSVEISNSVRKIGEASFAGCENLKNIELPNSVNTISGHAFSDCLGLLSVEIPDGVVSIGYNAFAECVNLQSIRIPDSVRVLGDFAFYNCYRLKSVEISDSVETIKEGTFGWCTALSYVEIPNSVTSIRDWAFDNCNNIIRIEIPDSVTSIGEKAFSGCDNLTIYGTEGSYAEKYANENGIPFISQ